MVTSEPASVPCRTDLDASHRWLVAMCRAWLLTAAGNHLPPVAEPPRVIIPDPSAGMWGTLDAMAQYHGVEPLLHAVTSVRADVAASVPEPLRAAWERAYFTTRIRNAETLALVAAVVADCRREGLEILVLKGPAIMADVHKDIGLRPMTDVDLLCRPRDLPRMAEILEGHCCRRHGRPQTYNISLTHRATGRLVELHFDVYPTFTQGQAFLDAAWRARRRVRLESWEIPVMAPEHQLVLELGHIAWHEFDVGLRHFVDLAGRLLLAGPPRPEALQTPLDHAGLRGAFEDTRSALADLFDLPLADDGRTTPEEACVTRGFTDALMHYGFVRRSTDGAGLRRQTTIGERLRYGWRRTVPPLDAVRAAYGIRTRAGAAAYLPVHVAMTVVDFARRMRGRPDPDDLGHA